MPVSQHLLPYLTILRDAFSNDLSEDERQVLSAVLFEEFSERNLGELLAEFLDDEAVVVQNEAVHAFNRRHQPAVLDEMRRRLVAAGWEFEDDELSRRR